jgi:hypothetical protein
VTGPKHAAFYDYSATIERRSPKDVLAIKRVLNAGRDVNAFVQAPWPTCAGHSHLQQCGKKIWSALASTCCSLPWGTSSKQRYRAFFSTAE